MFVCLYVYVYLCISVCLFLIGHIIDWHCVNVTLVVKRNVLLTAKL